MRLLVSVACVMKPFVRGFKNLLQATRTPRCSLRSWLVGLRTLDVDTISMVMVAHPPVRRNGLSSMLG